MSKNPQNYKNLKEFPRTSKFHFSQWKTYFFKFILINNIKNSRKLNISFFMLIFKWDQPHFIRGSHPKVFLRKGALKICSKFTGEHPCRSAISVKLLCNFIEITLPHECSPVNLLHIFRTNLLKNTPGWLLPFYVNCH